MSLIPHHGQHLEVLAQSLSQAIAQRQGEVFTSEYVMVQTHGMQRWLSLLIARHTGICAGTRFLFPNEAVRLIAEKAGCFGEEPFALDQTQLQWAIFHLLESPLTDTEVWLPVHRFLESGQRGLKQFDLSAQLADLFDQYAVYRPDLLALWNEGRLSGEKELARHEQWQMLLYRELKKLFPALCDKRDLFELLRSKLSGRKIGALKAFSLSVFGVSVLPPYHAEVLRLLSRHCDVTLYLFNPCNEYWFDIVSPRAAARMGGKRALLAASGDHGNLLLAEWGKAGRDFFDLLISFDELDVREGEPSPAPPTLLGMIQRDIAAMEEPQQLQEIEPEDESLLFASCISPLREVEALHNYLLRRLQNDSSLSTSDILVMTPSIEEYAPHIESVFGAGSPAISYALADRTCGEKNRLFLTLLKLFEVTQTRFELDQLLALSSEEAIRRKFKLDHTDLNRAGELLRKSGIRWGISGKHKQEFDLPEEPQNTWETGLLRIFAGYAMDPADQFDSVIPLEAIEGDIIHTLGGLIALFDCAVRVRQEIRQTRTLSAWADWLLGLLDDLFIEDEDSFDDLAELRAIIVRLGRAGEVLQGQAVAFAPVTRFISSQRLSESGPAGFLKGGVTFASMIPFRSIPFRVICLLGMSAESFPRRDITPGFDLMALKRRKGDRTRRLSDHYLFLETVMSAREYLYISYIGDDYIQPGTHAIPPATVVETLRSYIDRRYTAGEKAISSFLTALHPAVASSRRYFDNSSPRLYSYHAGNMPAPSSKQLPDPYSSVIPQTGAEELFTLSPARLLEFFKNPLKYLLRYRLSVHTGKIDEIEQSTELFSLDPLAAYSLEQVLLTALLSGKFAANDSTAALHYLRSLGTIPHGLPGEVLLKAELETVAQLAGKIQELSAGNIPRTTLYRQIIGGVVVEGAEESLYGRRLLLWRTGKLRPFDRIEQLLRLQLANRAGEADESLFLTVEKPYKGPPSIAVAPCTAPAECTYAETLTALYREGLVQPLPFEPDVSYEFLSNEGKGLPEALRKAALKWEMKQQQDTLYRLYGQHIRFDDPLFAARFIETAHKVFDPLTADSGNTKKIKRKA